MKWTQQCTWWVLSIFGFDMQKHARERIEEANLCQFNKEMSEDLSSHANPTFIPHGKRQKMPISKSTLSLIQKTGEALHKANRAVEKAVADHRESLIQMPSERLAHLDAETLFAQLREVATLSLQMIEMESKLVGIYHRASVLASPQSSVMNALPRTGGKSKPNEPYQAMALGVQTDLAQDLSFKTDTAVLAPVRRQRAKKILTRDNLSKNGKKVLAFFESVLNRETATSFTLHAIADGAGIAPGSVPESLAKVISTGAVVLVEKGSYKLGVAAQ
jgi:hypothetical protein